MGFRFPKKGKQCKAEKKEKINAENIEKGGTLRQLSLNYDTDSGTIKNWLKKLRSGGALYDVKKQGRPPKDPMARPKKKEPQTELEKLKYENELLRTELALLKKVKALVEQRDAQLQKIGQKPSKN